MPVWQREKVQEVLHEGVIAAVWLAPLRERDERMNQQFDEMSATEFAVNLRGGASDLLLLDVRERDELQVSRVDGALHIPMGDIPTRQQHIDPEKHIVVMCHHGSRSAMVAAFLKRQGFERVSNLRGGIDAWSLEVDPNVPRY